MPDGTARGRAAVRARDDEDALARRARDAVAGLKLSEAVELGVGADFWRTKALPGIPALTLSDGPSGLRYQPAGANARVVTESAPATCFPALCTLAASWDPALAERVGATIDGRPASIKDRLSTGQVVEIKSGKNQRPSPDWLNFVVTSKARNKIKLKLKEEELKKAATGRELLERRLKNWKMELPDEDLTILCKKYKLKTISDFYAAIADEKVDIMDVKSYISRKQQGEEEAAAIHSSQTPKDNGGNKEAARDSSTDDYLVIDGKLSNVSYKMARCCNPIYGDEVFGFVSVKDGFVSVKDGIKIHRMSCPNAARLIENYPYRIQKVRWKETSTTSSFQTTVKVITDDSAAYSSVIKTVTDFGASLRSSSMTPRAGRSAGEFDIRMQIFVSSNSVLDKIISAIRKTRGVLSAVRISK